MLPVPLNSSKMTWSMRLSVSMRAVPMIVRLPPSSTLRAELKNFFGLASALASIAAGHDAALAGLHGVVAAGEPGDAVEQDDDVAPDLDQAPGALAHHLRHLDVAGRRFVEGGGENIRSPPSAAGR